MRQQADSTCVQIPVFRIVAAAALAVMLVAPATWLAPPAEGQQRTHVAVRQRNIAQMVHTADVILRGEVLSAYVEQHPQLRFKTLVVTLKVTEVLKGQADAEYTFRQYLFDSHSAKNPTSYGPGQQYLLLMRNPNQYGVTSPAGMEQGRFLIRVDAAGNELASNPYSNVGLMKNVDQTSPSLKSNLPTGTQARMAQHTRGPIPYNDLKDLVRGAMAAGN